MCHSRTLEASARPRCSSRQSPKSFQDLGAYQIEVLESLRGARKEQHRTLEALRVVTQRDLTSRTNENAVWLDGGSQQVYSLLVGP